MRCGCVFYTEYAPVLFENMFLLRFTGRAFAWKKAPPRNFGDAGKMGKAESG